MFIKQTIHRAVGRAGYSLIELMMVIAIIGIMSIVAVIGYNENKKSIALDKAATRLVLDLRRAQSMAMNTALFDDDNNSGTPAKIPPGGYGINFGSLPASEYILYADFNGNKKYLVADSDVIVLTQTLDSAIVISNVTNATDIDFFPPNPVVYFNGSIPAGISTATITLRYGAAGGLTKKVIVNRITGQISID